MGNPLTDNPYSVPLGVIVQPPQMNRARIEGKSLVVPREWHSPRICLFTGVTSPLTAARKAKLNWSSPALLVLLMLGVVVYVIVAAIVQKKGTLHYFLSEAKAAQSRRRYWMNWGLLLVSLGLFVAGAVFKTIAFAWMGGLCLLTCLIGAATWCRLIVPSRIDNTFMWISGIPLPVMQQIIAMEQAQPGGGPPPLPGSGALAPLR
jgi:hypothetical protein